MKLNNKGFALTSIIYMLIVLFLTIMLLILANLASRKVVLDKIKNEVKGNLNQGGVLASSNMIVTFDPQGGQINQTSKQVTYNEPYGELPIPTRDGYKFIGWRGKNLFDKNSTPETNYRYIKNNGIQEGNGAFSIYNTSIKPNTQYTITNSGKSNAPGYALYDKGYNYLTGAGYSNTANVTFTTPSNAAYIKFSVVANLTQNETYRYDKDYFQLEEGSTATTYEPYQEYTSDTIVTKKENHTLYAMWTDIPELTLSKETYVDVPFDNTWTYSNATVEDGVLTLGAGSSTATSDFINVNGGFYYNIFDGYTDVVTPRYDPNGTIFWVIKYYDEQKNQATIHNKIGDGHAKVIELNNWKNEIYWKNLEDWKNFGEYSANVKYITISYQNESQYCTTPVKIRNLKVYGEEMPNSFYLINVKITDNDNIAVKKYAKGEQNLEYFNDNGTIFNNNQIRVTENGIYTVYVKDDKGAEKIETIEITNIQ